MNDITTVVKESVRAPVYIADGVPGGAAQYLRKYVPIKLINELPKGARVCNSFWRDKEGKLNEKYYFEHDAEPGNNLWSYHNTNTPSRDKPARSIDWENRADSNTGKRAPSWVLVYLPSLDNSAPTDSSNTSSVKSVRLGAVKATKQKPARRTTAPGHVTAKMPNGSYQCELSPEMAMFIESVERNCSCSHDFHQHVMVAATPYPAFVCVGSGPYSEYSTRSTDGVVEVELRITGNCNCQGEVR